QRVYIEQHAILARDALADIEDRLILPAVASHVEKAVPADLWRFNSSDGQQLLNPLSQRSPVEGGNGAEHGFGIGILCLDKGASLWRFRILQPAKGISDLVAVEILHHFFGRCVRWLHTLSINGRRPVSLSGPLVPGPFLHKFVILRCDRPFGLES